MPVKQGESNLDIVDCLLAAHASNSKPIMSFDYAQSYATCRFNNRSKALIRLWKIKAR